VSQLRSRSSSRDTAASSASVRVPESSAATKSTPTHLLTDAARVIIEQHHLSTEEELCSFLRAQFPEKSEQELRPLIIGAFVGAQCVSSFHFMVERTRVSGDPSKREIAINAGVALSELGTQELCSSCTSHFSYGHITSRESRSSQHGNSASIGNPGGSSVACILCTVLQGPRSRPNGRK